MHAARVLWVVGHVGRVVFCLGAKVSRRSERPIIRILNPAIGRVQQVDNLIDAVQALPLSRRVAAIQRAIPVE